MTLPRLICAAVFAFVSLPGMTFAACVPAAVEFRAGAIATSVQGGIARGERACFRIAARQAQTLDVTQPDTDEPNIAIQIYRPGWHISDDHGATLVAGVPLPGAEDGTDATHWSGTLPASGTYLLVAGAIRGGGEYRINIEIR